MKIPCLIDLIQKQMPAPFCRQLVSGAFVQLLLTFSRGFHSAQHQRSVPEALNISLCVAEPQSRQVNHLRLIWSESGKSVSQKRHARDSGPGFLRPFVLHAWYSGLLIRSLFICLPVGLFFVLRANNLHRVQLRILPANVLSTFQTKSVVSLDEGRAGASKGHDRAGRRPETQTHAYAECGSGSFGPAIVVFELHQPCQFISSTGWKAQVSAAKHIALRRPVECGKR